MKQTVDYVNDLDARSKALRACKWDGFALADDGQVADLLTALTNDIADALRQFEPEFEYIALVDDVAGYGKIALDFSAERNRTNRPIWELPLLFMWVTQHWPARIHVEVSAGLPAGSVKWEALQTTRQHLDTSNVAHHVAIQARMVGTLLGVGRQFTQRGQQRVERREEGNTVTISVTVLDDDQRSLAAAICSYLDWHKGADLKYEGVAP